MTVIAIQNKEPHALAVGGIGLVLWAAVAGFVVVYRRMKPHLSAAEKRARIMPSSNTACALCAGELSLGADSVHCSRCGAERCG